MLDTAEATDTFWRMTDDPVEPRTQDELAAAPPVLVLALANKRAYLDRYSQPDKSIYGLGEESAWPVPHWDVDAGMAAMLLMLAAIGYPAPRGPTTEQKASSRKLRRRPVGDLLHRYDW